jgi:hypothetical protein
MGRFFSPRYEYRSTLEGIEKDLQKFAGTRIWWYKLNVEETVTDDVYDMGVGRVFHRPIPLDVIQVLRVEGPQQLSEQGLFTRDHLEVVLSWGEIEKRGLTDIESPDQYLKARASYDGYFFTPRNIQVNGHIGEYDTLVHMRLQEVRDDETHYDPEMAPPRP